MIASRRLDLRLKKEEQEEFGEHCAPFFLQRFTHLTGSTIVPSEIARNSEPLAGLASLCQTFSEGD